MSVDGHSVGGSTHMFIYSPDQNRHLFDVAYAMFFRKETWETVLKDLWKENTWCRPPLTATEVKTIVANARIWVGGDENDPAFQRILERIRFASMSNL